MDVSVVKKQITTNNLQSFYIFAGEEWKVQQIYIDQIVKVSEKKKRYVDNFADIYSAMSSVSMFDDSFVYILRDDKDILSNEKLQESISDIIGDNILILLLTAVDKRTKFYKKYGKDIVEFERLKPQILKKYIRQAIDISDVNCDRLIEVCEYDYGRCLLEIDKIKQYGMGSVEDNRDVYTESYMDMCFRMLVEDGTIYTPPYDAIFDFVDAVLKRKVKTAFNLLYQSYAVGEAILVLLSVLYTNAKQILQVQTCTSDDVSKSTGLTAWQVKCAKERSGYYADDELEYMLRLIHKCECDIKQGLMEENVAVEYVLVHIM